MKRKNRGDVSTPPLTLAVKMWPTPTGTERSGVNPNTGKGEGLSKTVKNWPTPNCDDANNATRASGQYQSLTRSVVTWPTPCSRGDDKGGPVGLGGGQRAKEKLKEMVGREQQLQMSCGSLNPDWVEWLMGWPIGWTSLEPLTELVWLSWKIDPADMEEAEFLPTPCTSDNDHGHAGTWSTTGKNLHNYALSKGKLGELKRSGSGHGPIPRVATGIKDRVNRLKALGNGQVSLCAATAFRILAGQ